MNKYENNRHSDVFRIGDDSAFQRKPYSRDESQISTWRILKSRFSQINQHPLVRRVRNSMARAACKEILKYFDEVDHNDDADHITDDEDLKS